MSRAGPNISYCLTCAHLVNFYPTWWIFTPPSEFLPHLENFIHNPKNVRNTITIANTNIFVGGKFYPPPPKFVPPKKLPSSKNILIQVIRANFTFWKSWFFYQIWTPKFLPQGWNFLNLTINILLGAFFWNTGWYFYSSFCIWLA